MFSVYISLFLVINLSFQKFINSQIITNDNRKSNLNKFKPIFISHLGTNIVPFKELNSWISEWYPNAWTPFQITFVNPISDQVEPSSLIAQYRLEKNSDYKNSQNSGTKFLFSEFNESDENFQKKLKPSLKQIKKLYKNVNPSKIESIKKKQKCENTGSCVKKSSASKILSHESYPLVQYIVPFSQENDEILGYTKDRSNERFKKPFDSSSFNSDQVHQKFDRGQSFDYERGKKKKKKPDYPFRSKFDKDLLFFELKKYPTKQNIRTLNINEDDNEKVPEYSNHKDDFYNHYDEDMFNKNRYMRPIFPSTNIKKNHNRIAHQHKTINKSQNRYQFHNNLNDFYHKRQKFYSKSRGDSFNLNLKSNKNKNKNINQSKKTTGNDHFVKCIHETHSHVHHNHGYDDDKDSKEYLPFGDYSQGEESKRLHVIVNQSDFKKTKMFSEVS